MDFFSKLLGRSDIVVTPHGLPADERDEGFVLYTDDGTVYTYLDYIDLYDFGNILGFKLTPIWFASIEDAQAWAKAHNSPFIHPHAPIISSSLPKAPTLPKVVFHPDSILPTFNLRVA